MIHDNFSILSSLIQNKNAFFARYEINGAAHYFAANRAARRMVKSNSFATLAKNSGLKIDLETMSVF